MPSYNNLVDRVRKASKNSLARLITIKTIIQKNGDSILVKKPDVCEMSSQYDLEVNLLYLSYLPRIIYLIKDK